MVTRFRRLAAVLACAAVLSALSSSAVLAARPDKVPGQVARAALDTSPDGPIVATGTLRDESGKPTAGTVALNVLPNPSQNRKLKKGDALPVRTVGWATAGSDGRFELRVDLKGINRKLHVNRGGGISFEVVGWTADRQGTTFVAGSLEGAPADIELSAKKPLVTGPGTDTSAALLPVPSCVWIQQSTYDVWVAIGQTWPYGTDKGWMKSSTSHSFSVGVAISGSGAYGDWDASGTSSVESGITFTWAESTADREYREQHRYGKFRMACAGRYSNDWSTRELFGTGGYTTVSSTNPGFSNHVVTVSAGLWERNRTDGSHFKLSAGVKSSSVLGINLSVDTNYSQVREMSYRLSSTAKLYGDTNVPSLAARVRTAR